MLILPIKKKWFDMILSGKKKEEYREIKPYYTKRINNMDGNDFYNIKHNDKTNFLEVDLDVLFRNGYRKDSPTLKCKCRLKIGQGKEEWGAEKRKRILYFRNFGGRTMLNKEEIEESKKCLDETIQNTYAERKAIKLDNLKKYIEQLEQENTMLKSTKDMCPSMKTSGIRCNLKTLNKEEIKELFSKHPVTAEQEAFKYIEQLENKVKEQEESRQELINYLKQKIEEHTFGKEIEATAQTCKEILNLIEGEKNV